MEHNVDEFDLGLDAIDRSNHVAVFSAMPSRGGVAIWPEVNTAAGASCRCGAVCSRRQCNADDGKDHRQVAAWWMAYSCVTPL